MIPWFELHVIQLGPLRLQVWGLLVATGLLVAFWAGARRAKRLGEVDAKDVWDFAACAFVCAFVCARIFHVLFYDPSWYLVHPLDAINPTLPGYSMMGGIIGGVLAGLVFIKKRKLPFWPMADLAGYSLPLGIGIGRIGCFLIHDHPGTLTNFILGVKYPDGVRHDHGLYLSLLGWAMFILFLILARKKRQDGFFAGWFLILDGVSRFLLDFLRLNDVRYAGLTPTQWLLMATVTLGVVMLTKPGWIAKPRPVKADVVQ